MKRFALAFLIFLILVSAKITIAARIPPDIKKVVVFIFVQGKDGKLSANGTGFLVGVKNSQRPEMVALYLVTAKHVIQDPNTKLLFPFIFVRANTKDGKADISRLSLAVDGAGKDVFVHEESAVDLAVLPLSMDESRYDYKFIPDDLITTKDDFNNLHITEGSEVFFTGLFVPYIGDTKNYPIVRFGRVALVTDEKIEWNGAKTDLYLLESASYGGNSGSPVFFYLGADREPESIIIGDPVIKLAGIMEGFFGEPRPIQLAQTSTVPVSISNVGISAVIPAYKLREILFSNELKNQRKF